MIYGLEDREAAGSSLLANYPNRMHVKFGSRTEVRWSSQWKIPVQTKMFKVVSLFPLYKWENNELLVLIYVTDRG
jgi:hypothetical protein